RRERRLPGVARVGLLDRDNVEEPPAAGLVTPDALHVRNPHLLDLVPDERGFRDALAEGVIRRWSAGSRAGEDRIVSVVDGLDAHKGLGALAAGVVARPLPEG